MDNNIYSRFHIHPTEDDRYVLIKDFTWRGYTYGAGTSTNGGNIPTLFRSFILPFAPRLIIAFLIHDYWCSKGEYKRADNLFYLILKELGVSKWKRRAMVTSVRQYHRWKYGVK